MNVICSEPDIRRIIALLTIGSTAALSMQKKETNLFRVSGWSKIPRHVMIHQAKTRGISGVSRRR